MLVVLEGLDGAGKSTQVKKLREYLESVSKSLEYIHFPRYDAPVYGELIGKFLRGGFGSVDEVHPQLVALLYAGDRHDAAAHIREVLDSGGTVLLDRYVYSNIAYQCAKAASEEEAEALRQWIFDMEYGSFGIPKPDLNIFLDVPLSFVEASLSQEREGGDRDARAVTATICTDHATSTRRASSSRRRCARCTCARPRWTRISSPWTARTPVARCCRRKIYS